MNTNKEKEKKLYNKYSDYLKHKYGEKVHKITINLPLTCPNRVESRGWAGCTFCGEKGTDFEVVSPYLSVSEQIKESITVIGKRYKTKKFIAYFQNYTNTYMPLELFKKHMTEACQEDIVEISISTRPDCIREDYLEFLQQLAECKNVEISIELGLQTVNYHTLNKLNRGHSLAEFIDAVLLCQRYKISVCAHVILNLPYDNEDDTIECAKILSALPVDQVKIHSLYLLKGTAITEDYLRGHFKLISLEEYVNRVITFLEYLNPRIVIQRLVGKAPETKAIFANWGTSIWKINSQIELEMFQKNSWQGKRSSYLIDSNPFSEHFNSKCDMA